MKHVGRAVRVPAVCAKTHHGRGAGSRVFRHYPEPVETNDPSPRGTRRPSNKAIALFRLILSMWSAIKEECLTDDRLQTIYIERFGYKKCGLWRGPGEESFWICSNEYYRYGDRFQDLIDSFESRASVRKLNIREYEARLVALNRFCCLAMGSRDI